MAVYELRQNGSERYAKLSSFNAQLVLNGHDTIVAFILPTGVSPEVRFDIDDEVELLKDSTPIAGGIVTHVGEEMEPEGGPNNNGRFLSRITVSGWGEIATRRHVSLTTSSGSPADTLSEVLQELIDMTDGLGDDGVTLHPSQDVGPSVSAMSFEDALPSEILNTLARDTGRVWRIDEQKRLRMWAKGDIAAAFDIDEDDLPAKYFGDIRPSRSRFDGYANRVIVKGTTQTILQNPEDFTSNGVSATFNATNTILGVSFIAVKITNVPSLGIAADGALWESVGPPSAGRAWSFDADAGTFTRTAGVLPNGANIRIWYDAEVTPRGVANDPADQGSPPSRVRDEIVHAPVTTDAAAQALAEEILPYFVAAKETKATYSSRETDLILPGVTQTMTVPLRGLSGEFLVERVVLRSGPGEINSYLIQDIETTQNQVLKGDWRDLLNRFVTGPSGNTVRNGAGDSGGDVITNPDGDAGGNIEIPPDHHDVFFNKNGAIGTHITEDGIHHFEMISDSPDEIAAGGSPAGSPYGSPAGDSDRVQLRLTTLHDDPDHSLLKLRTPDDGGVMSWLPWSTLYNEHLLGAEIVDGRYIARSEDVGLIYQQSDTGPGQRVLGLELWVQETPGSEMTFDNRRGMYIIDDGTAGLHNEDMGSGSPGRIWKIGRNDNSSGAAGVLGLQKHNADGFRYIWVDAGDLVRVSTAPPQADGSPSDTSGVVVGSQSCTRAVKTMLGEVSDRAASLALMLSTKIERFRYKNGAYSGQEFIGITAEDSPAFAMDAGRVFNPISSFGHTVLAIQELDRRVSELSTPWWMRLWRRFVRLWVKGEALA